MSPVRKCKCPHCGYVHAFAGAIPSHPARTSDRETSHIAAEKHALKDMGRFSTRNLSSVVLRAYSRHEPMTALEAADLLFDRQIAQHETSRKRVSDLTTVGYLRVSGDRRNNPGSSSPADVLYITAEGFRALDNLRETGWSK